MIKICKLGDKICLLFPPLPGNSKYHRVFLPINEKGFEILIRILSEQECSGFENIHIAEPGAPVQHMIEQWLRENSVKRKKIAAPETLTLEDLDL